MHFVFLHLFCTPKVNLGKHKLVALFDLENKCIGRNKNLHCSMENKALSAIWRQYSACPVLSVSMELFIIEKHRTRIVL